MNIIVAGGRTERLTPPRAQALADLLWHIQPSDGRLTLLLGGARGIDSDVQAWSNPMGYPYRLYLPDWGSYGRAAGPLRNARMVADADALIAFPGGRGTANVIQQARDKGIRVYLME